ncbi:MAG TPA: hypothetical protein VFZ53_09265 [Polyangiaceae bacterium]
MLRPVFFLLVGLALGAGCGSSTGDSNGDGEGNEAGAGSSNGGSSNGGSSSGGSSGNAGTASGGGDTGGTSSGGTSSGGTGAQGGSGALGGSAGNGAAGFGGTGVGGTDIVGMPTDPDCPVNEPENGSMCTDEGLRCPYVFNGCRCLNIVGNLCYQMDASCVPMLAPAAGDRIAPPPVHFCTCTTSLDSPAAWNCE